MPIKIFFDPKKVESFPAEYQAQAEDINKLLFLLHSTPIKDSIGITICEETKLDSILMKVAAAITNGDINNAK